MPVVGQGEGPGPAAKVAGASPAAGEKGGPGPGAEVVAPSLVVGEREGVASRSVWLRAKTSTPTPATLRTQLSRGPLPASALSLASAMLLTPLSYFLNIEEAVRTSTVTSIWWKSSMQGLGRLTKWVAEVW